ncbi:MAG: zinc ribbon domain-containing protein [Nitrospirae bacterium]|nr:zinc ribbon domain-containing protein [Nitrospirota bacterium]
MPHKLSPMIFGIVLVCFLLPFVNVSCSGQHVATFSGLQLVTGTTVNEPGLFGTSQPRKVKGEMLAVLAFLSGIAGLVFSFSAGRVRNLASSVIGFVGVILLFLMKSKIDKDVLRQTGGVVHLDYGLGYYLALLLFIAAIAVSVYSIMQEKNIPVSPINNKSTGPKFCVQCGAKAESSSAYCSECGHSMT